MNPILCWGGLVSMFIVVVMGVKHRDKKAWFIIVGYLAQLVPWMFVTRITFEYQYFPCTVFLVLAMGYVFSYMRDYAPNWKRPVYSFTAVSVALFLAFYPVLSGLPVASGYGKAFLKWLPGWPF